LGVFVYDHRFHNSRDSQCSLHCRRIINNALYTDFADESLVDSCNNLGASPRPRERGCEIQILEKETNLMLMLELLVVIGAFFLWRYLVKNEYL